MTSTFLYGAQTHASGIRQHFLRYGGPRGRGGKEVLLESGIWGLRAR